MSTNVPANIGWGGSGLDKTLKTILDGFAVDSKLAQLKISPGATGAAVSTNIAVAGLTTDDVLIGAVVVDGMGAATPSFSAIQIVGTAGVSSGMSEAATPIAVNGYIRLNIATADALVYLLYTDVSARTILESTDLET